MGPLRALAVALCAVPVVATTAAADEPESLSGAYSIYEVETIRAAERAMGSQVDPSPEGKIVERIDILRLDPFEPRDPGPVAADVIHTTTREDIVRHELLLSVGQPYRKVLVDESARNLRGLPQVSLVLCVAMHAGGTDRVRLVVITKDVWSLYPDFDLGVTPGGLELLLLEPKETNLGGRQETLTGRLLLQPESYALGGSYLVPRLALRWLKLVVDGNVIVNRASGAAEGSYGAVTIERPLYTARAEWSWFAGVTWRDEMYRQYTNAHVATFDVKGTPQTTIPWVYRSRQIDELASVTRSYGWARKTDLTFGVEASHDQYRLPDLSAYDPSAVAEFAREKVPVGETRVAPFGQLRAYTSDFSRVFDAETLALQEDYRLGHDVLVRAYPVASALGSTRTFLGVRAAAMYTWPLGDGLVRAWVDSTVEAGTSEVSDASVAADLRIVSPRAGVGRVVFDATVLDRFRNYLNRKSLLGGDTRLRGYPTRHFVGNDMLAVNLEYRTLPVEIAACQWAGTLFYDIGDAFDSFDQLRPAHSVGLGFRVVFPQIDRVVLRGDVGFPIIAGPLPQDVAPVSFFLTFEQAFRADALPTPMGP